ncbi:MAG: acetyl-CoA carboxylase biotin carboxyl carrier protein [Ignavibacteria bacterium]|nr:acetyl-CoA carboxylase biotin carboxyl carrier protein [Ignavibacteria bacterium]
MKTDLSYIKKLIKMLDESSLADLELEEEGIKIRLSKPRPKMTSPIKQLPFQMMPQVNAPADNKGHVQEEKPKEEELKSENLIEIKSPMVGTFYKAPSPESDPYVNIGSSIKEGMVICIIEAMKLMNEIESEVSGKIVKILVENGQAVEYDQPLFLVEKI